MASYFVITAAGLTVLAVTSWDVIKAELNSVYPGNAPSSSGGTGLWWMMKYPISLVSRFSMNELIVENSSIICFAPAGFILALWVIIKEKKEGSFTHSFTWNKSVFGLVLLCWYS